MILDYKDIPIFYSITGKGKSVVLLHGFLENSTMWEKLLPQLSKNNQIICIDLLGHGQTGCLGYIHKMSQMAEAVEAVLNHLNVEKPIFIGHSMGGYVALAFAEKHPEMLNGLCLMNSTFEADDDERKSLRFRANKMISDNFNNMVRLSFTNLFSNNSLKLHKVEVENALNEGLNTSIQGYIAAQEGMRIRKERFDILKSLTCRKLIIIGKKDPVINVIDLKNKVKKTDINTVTLSEGHMSHIENRSILLQEIMHFIENI